jgi:hypothetical protein
MLGGVDDQQLESLSRAMLGWHISVYRQPNGGTTPADPDALLGSRLAVWQGGLGVLSWFGELVNDGDAIDLGGNGYPTRYTARAEHLIPRIVGGPPGAREHWLRESDDVVDERWLGRTVIDSAVVADCNPDEWLLVVAWDES